MNFNKFLLSAFCMSIALMSLPTPNHAQANRDRMQNFFFWRAQLQNPIKDMKIIALQRLAAIRNLEAVNAIGPMLSSETPDIRFQAARSLGRLPSRRALEMLGERAPSEPDVYIKAEINRSIQTLKDYFEKLDAENAKKEEEIPE